jgi:hypothetical protein
MLWTTEEMLFRYTGRYGSTQCIVFNSEDVRLALPDREFIEIPDDWIMWVKDGRLAVGQEDGFPNLTPKGFHTNIEKMKKAWQDYNPDGTEEQWNKFYDNVQAFFANVAKKTRKHLSNLEAKIEDGHKSLQALVDGGY